MYCHTDWNCLIDFRTTIIAHTIGRRRSATARLGVCVLERQKFGRSRRSQRELNVHRPTALRGASATAAIGQLQAIAPTQRMTASRCVPVALRALPVHRCRENRPSAKKAGTSSWRSHRPGLRSICTPHKFRPEPFDNEVNERSHFRRHLLVAGPENPESRRARHVGVQHREKAAMRNMTSVEAVLRSGAVKAA